MGQRKNNTDFSSTGEKFGELMRGTFKDKCEYDENMVRPVDYSFMYERKNQYINNSFFASFSRVAVVLLVFFVAVMGTAIWINSNPANAGKFKLEKVFTQIKNSLFTVQTEESPDTYFEENTKIVEFTRLEDIDAIKKVMPEICIPTYIPEGYELEKLKIVESVKESYIAIYTYIGNNDKRLSINVHDFMSESQNADLYESGEKIEMENRTIYLWKEEFEEGSGANIIIDNLNIFICGNIEYEEIKKISVGLE